MSAHKKLIVLDFDHTVFNTTKLVTAWKTTFERLFDISEAEFMQHRDLIKETNSVIDLDNFVASFPADHPETLKRTLHDTIKDCAGTWTFADVLPFIAAHKDNFDLMIATHGDNELQSEKITHSGIPGDIPYAISTKDKATVVDYFLTQYEHVYFIDDKPENITLVKEAHGDKVTTYFIVRPEDSPYKDQPFVCECTDFTIGSLDEVKIGE